MGVARAGALVVLAGALAGCSAIPLPPQLAGPPIVEGRVLDANGLPVVGARVRMSITDVTDTQTIGPVTETVFDATTTTDGAGRFLFTGQPSADLLEFAGGGGAVTFEIEATSPTTGAVGRSLIERRLDGGTWDGAAPNADVLLPAAS